MATVKLPTVRLTDVKVGDRIGRRMGYDGPVMWLTVTEIDDSTIRCNLWEFDRSTGMEIDHDLQWGPEYGQTGSFIAYVQPGVEADSRANLP